METTNEDIKCEKCKGTSFKVDHNKSGYEQVNPHKQLKIDEQTEWHWKTWFICSECDHPLNIPILGPPDPGITITIHFKK